MKEDKNGSKKHKIKTINDLCNIINDNNIDMIVIDIANWLYMYHNAIKNFKAEYPEYAIGKSNVDIIKATLEIIEDNKNDLNIIIKKKK